MCFELSCFCGDMRFMHVTWVAAGFLLRLLGSEEGLGANASA